MLDKMEMNGKKAANVVIVGGCIVGQIACGVVEFYAACGELTCFGIRKGAEYIEDKLVDVELNGGLFKIDETKGRERAEEILTQYQ